MYLFLSSVESCDVFMIRDVVVVICRDQLLNVEVIFVFIVYAVRVFLSFAQPLELALVECCSPWSFPVSSSSLLPSVGCTETNGRRRSVSSLPIFLQL